MRMLCLLAATSLGVGDGVASAAPADPAAVAPPDWMARSQQPFAWLRWGADLRVRDEYFENAFFGLNPDVYNQLRVRTRVWTELRPAEPLRIVTRLAWEFRYFSSPDAPVPAYSPAVRVDAFEPDEAIIDNLALRWTNLLGTPLSLSVGRQDMRLGNGWLLGDGTHRDGSRTMFFDAARLGWNLPGEDTSLEAIYIDQGAETDRWLPPLNAQPYRHYLGEQNERGAALVLATRALHPVSLEGFFIYKHNDRVLPTGLQGETYVPYLRATADLGEGHWRLRGELAPEWGQRDGRAHAALGVNTLATYLFQDPIAQQLRLGVEHLSGDDPETEADERFDILWGRWAQYSELLGYNPATGPRSKEWGNYTRVQAGWGCQPLPRVSLSADYHALWAVEDELPPLGAGGDFRGHLLVTLLEYTPSRHVKTHARAELFWPGDYYDGTGWEVETALFLRGEVVLTW